MTQIRLAVVGLLALSGCGGGSSGGGGGTTDPPPTGGGAPAYVRLSEAGLYTDIASKALAPDLLDFQPTHFLWSDGSDKQRWIRLPAGSQIDTSDIDRWQLPVGTQVFKEFSLGGVRLETRLIERYGAGPDDYWMGAFVWSADGSDAIFAPDGAQNVLATAHDVPSTAQCLGCHRGEPGRLLGFTAVQLSRERAGVTLDSLVAQGRLSVPPPAGATYTTPGDPTTAAAIGYLHANCGHCHSPQAIGFTSSNLELRLTTQARTLEETGVYRTAVDQPLALPHGDFVFRIRPGFPEDSAIWGLMMTRDGTQQQMPPIATEFADPTGLELVASWIRSLE